MDSAIYEGGKREKTAKGVRGPHLRERKSRSNEAKYEAGRGLYRIQFVGTGDRL